MSSELHKRLLQVVRDQDAHSWVANHELPDCSCGCKWFVELAGEVGLDWGVCSCPKSPRAGLLTFEHQGCKEFKYDESLNDED
jgi:hypothetical protein